MSWCVSLNLHAVWEAVKTVIPERDVKFGWYLRAEDPETTQFLLTVAITNCTTDTESLQFVIIAIEKSTNRGNKILNITLFSGPNGLKSNCSSLRWFSEAWGKPHNNTYGSHLSALASCFTGIHLIHPIVYWNTSTKQKFNYLCFVDSEGKNGHLYETDKFLFANYASVCLRKTINQLCWFRVLAAIFSNLTLASF